MIFLFDLDDTLIDTSVYAKIYPLIVKKVCSYLDIDEKTADKYCTDEKLEEYMNKEMYTPRSTKRMYK